MKKHTRILVALGIVTFVCIGGLFSLYQAAQQRLEKERAGIGAVAEPALPEPLLGRKDRTGAFTCEVEYTAMNAPADARVATTVAWDDDWFFDDPTVYNHELATTCSVLSAIANSESAYYQSGSGSPAYMEHALAELGFEDISTASYRYRSEIFDEILDFFTQTDDVTAYSVASKHITDSETGDTKTLLFVSIRGSYGSEWLSDVNFGNPGALDLDASDHEGFAEAAQEIIDALGERLNTLASEGGSCGDVALLFTGHSRGAATANLAASYADDLTMSLRALAPLDSIYAYTFATPGLTLMDNVDDAIYNNIFNILNPSDMVPRMPLEAWGFQRYGHSLWLPEPGVEEFDTLFEAMESHYFKNVGAENPSVPADAEHVDRFQEDLAARIAMKEDFTSLGGAASTVQTLMSDMNALQVLCSHYPNAYIAWMQAIGEGNLRAER